MKYKVGDILVSKCRLKIWNLGSGKEDCFIGQFYIITKIHKNDITILSQKNKTLSCWCVTDYDPLKANFNVFA
jgi:hypothetical protein